jgi:hypothetical protein
MQADGKIIVAGTVVNGFINEAEIGVPGQEIAVLRLDADGSGRTEAAVYSPTGGFILYQPADGGPLVKIDIGRANDGSIPVVGPAGDLLLYSKPDPKGAAIRAGAIVPPSDSTNAITSGAIKVSGGLSRAIEPDPGLDLGASRPGQPGGLRPPLPDDLIRPGRQWPVERGPGIADLAKKFPFVGQEPARVG